MTIFVGVALVVGGSYLVLSAWQSVNPPPLPPVLPRISNTIVEVKMDRAVNSSNREFQGLNITLPPRRPFFHGRNYFG